MGVSKGTRSSDSWRKAFVRKVREIDVTVNWSISMLVVREGCQPPLREKNRFLQVPVVGTKTICRSEGLSSNKS